MEGLIFIRNICVPDTSFDQAEDHTRAALAENILSNGGQLLSDLDKLLLVRDVVQQPLDDEVSIPVTGQLLLPAVKKLLVKCLSELGIVLSLTDSNLGQPKIRQLSLSTHSALFSYLN